MDNPIVLILTAIALAAFAMGVFALVLYANGWIGEYVDKALEE